ncbi:hypothetical protein [Acinetobacter venetianus]|uniref:Uncharacterized protein n=1 Tax=Acinetobacter venetianus TaxID=52133 RepID=A0A150HQ85_9GAMM|nr:hypothetical protein [Acinetobacter venetianus]KXZ68763.1 hypothetical protein AVENLUH13518_02923 [Acinetobacter venetianus]
MKKIILFCCLSIALFNTAYAKEEAVKGDLNNVIEMICIDATEYAQQVMHDRQTGVTIVDALKELNKNGVPDSPRNKFFKSIVYDVYKAPKIFDKEQGKAFESEYSNKVYMTCYESFSKELSK